MAALITPNLDEHGVGQVRLKTSGDRTQFTAFVTTDAGEVRVRFRRSDTADQWRCDQCGSHRFSTCTHERAARRAYAQQRDA